MLTDLVNCGLLAHHSSSPVLLVRLRLVLKDLTNHDSFARHDGFQALLVRLRLVLDPMSRAQDILVPKGTRPASLSRIRSTRIRIQFHLRH